MLSCPRKYYLDYVKNVGGNVLKWPDKHITRGNLVHTILENLVIDGSILSLRNCDFSERKRRISILLKEQLDNNYRMDAVLHILADTPLKDVEKDVMNRLTSVLNEDEFYQLFDGTEVKSEIKVNRVSGFTGYIDFVLDGIPIELKTASKISDDHILQLKVYILTKYLEYGIDYGYLLYTTRTKISEEENPSNIHLIRIDNDDIDRILYSRYQVLLQRKGINLPDTYHKDCVDCRYQKNSDYTLQKFWPACQYYCQTERNWKCYDIDPDGTITSSCILSYSCPVRGHYFDIEIIDHFNRIRRALMIENEEYVNFTKILRNLPSECLYSCGQLLKDLRLVEVTSEGCKYVSLKCLPCLDCTIGDNVIIKTNDGLHFNGILKEIGNMSITVQFYGNTDPDFLNDSNEFILIKDYYENRPLRSLLKVIDNIQRNLNFSLPLINKGNISKTSNILPYNAEDVTSKLEKNRLIAVQTTNQSDVNKNLIEIINKLPKPSKILIVLKDSLEIQEFINIYPKKHEMLVIDREENFVTGAQTIAISHENTPEEIVEKINYSSIFITKKPFILNSNLFELLHLDGRRVSFDYVIITTAEEYFEPQIYYLQNIGYNILLLGDAYRDCQVVKSKEARDLGLETGLFTRMIKFDSYFISKDFTIFYEPFKNLPPQINSALKNLPIKYSTLKNEGNVKFINVDGYEVGDLEIHYKKSINIADSDEGIKYRIVLKPLVEIKLSNTEEIFNDLKEKSLDNLIKGKTVILQEIPFLITDRYSLDRILESEENVEILIILPISYLESFEKIMFSNKEEAAEIVKIILNMSPEKQKRCAIITPFISQASLIKSLFCEEKILDIPVLLPSQIGHKSYDISIVSFVSSNKERMLRYPLTKLETIYTILTSAKEELILVGSKETLCQNRILKQIINSSEI